MWISKKKLEQIKSEAFDAGKRGIDGAMQTIIDLKIERDKLQNKLQSEKMVLQSKNNSLSEKIREQSKADMIFSALKVIIDGVKDDVKKEYISPEYQQMLIQQQQAQQAMPYNTYSFYPNGLYSRLI